MAAARDRYSYLLRSSRLAPAGALELPGARYCLSAGGSRGIRAGVHRPRPTALGKGRRVLGKSIHANKEHPTPGTALYLCCPPTVCRRVRFAIRGKETQQLNARKARFKQTFAALRGRFDSTFPSPRPSKGVRSLSRSAQPPRLVLPRGTLPHPGWAPTM